MQVDLKHFVRKFRINFLGLLLFFLESGSGVRGFHFGLGVLILKILVLIDELQQVVECLVKALFPQQSFKLLLRKLVRKHVLNRGDLEIEFLTVHLISSLRLALSRVGDLDEVGDLVI